MHNFTFFFKLYYTEEKNYLKVCLFYFSGEYHLQTTNDEIQSKSWYSYIYPEDLQEAKDKHTQCKSSTYVQSIKIWNNFLYGNKTNQT